MTSISGNSRRVSRRRFLFIDDNYDFFISIKTMIGDRADLDYAPDGFSALHMVKNERYDAIVSDVFMPYLDGIRLVGEFNKKHYDIPFILITGSLEEKITSDAFQAGAYNVLQKPFKVEELLEKLERAIQLHGSEKVSNIGEQERAHIYNMLKMYYYDVEKIILLIQHFQIPVSCVQEEIEKKENVGKCIFDDLQNLKYYSGPNIRNGNTKI